MFFRISLLILILPAFAFSYTIVRTDGKVFSGRLIQQSPEATIIRDSEGVTLRFRANQIDWNQTSLRISEEEEQRMHATKRFSPQRNQEIRSSERNQQWTGEPFTFDFKDIDIKDLFRFFADISGLNVILDPAVRGTVTLKLTEVPWDQALDLVTRNQGLGYTMEGNVIRIAPFSKLEQEEIARRRIEQERLLNAPLVTKMFPLSYAKAAEIEPIIKKLLTRKGSTIVDRRTNTLIVTDIETNNALWDSTFGL
jgi:type IV pilus assembly protein PilQ